MLCQEKVKNMGPLLKSKGLDALIIVNSVDMLYFSGTLQGNLLLILSDGQTKLFTRRALDRALSDIECGEALAFKSFREVRSYLPETIQKIGFLLDVTPAALYQKLQQDLGLSPEQCFDFSGELRNFKMIKSPAEIALIREAGSMVSDAYRELAKIIQPGMSEREIASELEYILMMKGHLGENRFRGYNQPGFITYVLSGSNIFTPAVNDTPYAGSGVSKGIGQGPSWRKVSSGEPLMIDTVANYEGYHNDMSRLFVLGEPSAELERRYQHMREIYDFVIGELLPGALCEDIYQKTLSKVAGMGYEGNFMGLPGSQVSFIGHGIGIEVDELPVFAKRFTVPLAPGMTVALEPKLFFEDMGGVGIESTFLITEKGAEPLFTLSEDMLVVS